MPSKIGQAFSRAAADGRIGKADVKNIFAKAADGQGITKAEAAKLRKLRESFADSFTTKGAEAFDQVLAKMNRSWSRTKNVHLPNVDEKRIEELMSADPRIGIYTGRAGGSESSGTTTRRTTSPAPRRRVSGGE